MGLHEVFKKRYTNNCTAEISVYPDSSRFTFTLIQNNDDFCEMCDLTAEDLRNIALRLLLIAHSKPSEKTT